MQEIVGKHEIRYYLLLVLLLNGLVLMSAASLLAQHAFVRAFQQISNAPTSITFKNTLPINPEGGHIQGIQWVQPDYILLSGSSSTVSYYASAKDGQLVKVDTLLHRPYKHAGGFQVNDGLLAIGVEDNEAKNTSQILIYDLSDPANPSDEPLQIIRRDGEAKRATAGCVAIAKFQQQYLVLVGDWDTRHLDLYQLPIGHVHDATAEFTLVESVTLEEHPRDGWIDNAWWPYQNINLFNSDGVLYLIGLGINDQEENVADFFTISLEPTIKLTKVATQIFPQQQQTSFLWGASVDWQPEAKKMRILATPYTIESTNTIIIYQ